jgi:hypothetical protein
MTASKANEREVNRREARRENRTCTNVDERTQFLSRAVPEERPRSIDFGCSGCDALRGLKGGRGE